MIRFEPWHAQHPNLLAVISISFLFFSRRTSLHNGKFRAHCELGKIHLIRR